MRYTVATSVKISENIFNEARTVSKALNRSIAGQIEYWAKLGKLSEENPEYNYEFIKDILLAREEANSGKLEEFIL